MTGGPVRRRTETKVSHQLPKEVRGLLAGRGCSRRSFLTAAVLATSAVIFRPKQAQGESAKRVLPPSEVHERFGLQTVLEETVRTGIQVEVEDHGSLGFLVTKIGGRYSPGGWIYLISYYGGEPDFQWTSSANMSIDPKEDVKIFWCQQIGGNNTRLTFPCLVITPKENSGFIRWN